MRLLCRQFLTIRGGSSGSRKGGYALRTFGFCLLVLLFGSKTDTQLEADGNAWTLVWSDEFNKPDGAAPDLGKWGFDIGGGG